MHILYVQQLLSLPGSPGTQRSWEMAKQWQQAGHKVSILCTSALFPPSFLSTIPPKKTSSLNHEGIDLHVLPIAYSHFMPFSRRLLSFFSFYFRAFSYAKDFQEIDLVLAYSAPLSSGFLGHRLARRLHCPFVFEVADVWPDVPIGMGIIKHPCLIRFLHKQTRRLYQSARRICTFTEDMKAQILAHDIEPQQVQVVHNGVNLDHFVYEEKGKPQKSGLRVVYTGSLGMANRVSQILHAWKFIEEKFPEGVSCEILGEGNEAEALQQLARELDLQRLHFHEPLPQQDIPKFLAEADIGLVSVAPFEVLEANGSTKAFEYMAAGIPLVLNYEGWLSTYLSTHDCGLSAPLGNVEAFAQQIERLLSDKNLRLRQGKNARKLAAEKFDRKHLAQVMLDTFENLL